MNGLCYFEIPADDLNRVRKFYKEVFGWESEESGDEYAMIKPGDGPGGGFSTNFDPVDKPGFNFYIEVPDIVKTLDKVKAAGGKVVKEKTEISPEYGFLAFFRDSEGNSIGLWSKD